MLLHMSKYKKKNEDILSIMSNLQPNCCLKVDFQKVMGVYTIVKTEISGK